MLEASLSAVGAGIEFGEDVTARVAEFMTRFEGQIPPSARYGRRQLPSSRKRCRVMWPRAARIRCRWAGHDRDAGHRQVWTPENRGIGAPTVAPHRVDAVL
jgi:hypothetical protein